MPAEPHEPVIIELDDPASRSAGVIGVVIVLAIVGIILAPFLINAHARPERVENRPSQTTSNRQMCQPRFDVPEFLEPVTHFALPGFMRLCDWLVPAAPPASWLTPVDRGVIQPLPIRTSAIPREAGGSPEDVGRDPSASLRMTGS